MILSRLKEYTDLRMELPPPMYGENAIAWYITLLDDGTWEGVTSLKSKEAKRGKTTLTPHIGRTVAVKPKLLADTGEYILGIPKATSKPDRVADCHAQFKELIAKCAQETGEASVKAIDRFLNSPELETVKAELLQRKDFDPGDVMTFRVGEIIPADPRYKLDAIAQFWEKYTSGNSDEKSDKDNPVMTCLITGEITKVEQRLPFLVKGLIGGQPSGTALVSANSKPFTSYGLENSLTSPISRDAAERFTKALNSLLSNEQSRIYIGSTVFVWWTREQTGFNPLNFLNKPKAEDVEALLKSPITAQKASSFDNTKSNQFYALALTANNARAVIRDWLETTVPNVQANVQEWFRHQELVDPYGDKPRPFGTYTLAASLYRDAAKEMQASVPVALMRSAILGERLPQDLLVKLIRRNRSEQEITYPRAVLLKLIFSRHPSYQHSMTNMEQLNPNPNLQGNDAIAYACGRLLAVLESTQKLAVGSVNAALSDRYYGAASSTPAIAFPPLLKLSRAHFSKLRKTKPGACQAIEERFEAITTQISTFPKAFSLQQQGLFGLGYYHQKASDRAQAKAKARKSDNLP
jgi:CRISPR-associated protein Csd1